MKTTRRILRPLLAATVVALLAVTPASSQETTLTPSHREALLELMQLLRIEHVLESSIRTMTDVAIQGSPELEQFRPELVAFFGKYFAWSELRDKYVELYGATFTEQEVRELSAFYRTPVGKKSAEVLPSLMERGAEIGQRQVEANLPELEKMIAEATRKRSGIQ